MATVKGFHDTKGKEGTYRYNAQKAHRDVLANWRNFLSSVAKRSVGDDLDGLESTLKHADRYIQNGLDVDNVQGAPGQSVWFIDYGFHAYKSRRRADAKRSRQGDVESDRHISQEKKDFWNGLWGNWLAQVWSFNLSKAQRLKRSAT